jgi:hypothetical protein
VQRDDWSPAFLGGGGEQATLARSEGPAKSSRGGLGLQAIGCRVNGKAAGGAMATNRDCLVGMSSSVGVRRRCEGFVKRMSGGMELWYAAWSFGRRIHGYWSEMLRTCPDRWCSSSAVDSEPTFDAAATGEVVDRGRGTLAQPMAVATGNGGPRAGSELSRQPRLLA